MSTMRRVFSENRRIVWLLAAALLVNAALYVLVVRPLAHRVATEEEQAGAATRDLNAARRAHEAARGTVTGKKQADEELQKFYGEVLPPDQSAARRLLYLPIDQLARSSEVTALQSRLQPDEERDGRLGKLMRTLNLTGEYSDVRRFIHELETAPEFLVLEGIVLSQGGADGEQRLSVTAQIATYFRTATNGD